MNKEFPIQHPNPAKWALYLEIFLNITDCIENQIAYITEITKDTLLEDDLDIKDSLLPNLQMLSLEIPKRLAKYEDSMIKDKAREYLTELLKD